MRQKAKDRQLWKQRNSARLIKIQVGKKKIDEVFLIDAHMKTKHLNKNKESVTYLLRTFRVSVSVLD